MTNIHQWLNKILEKWPVKVICLILAILIYLFHEASLVEKKTIVVPLNVIQEGIVTCVVEPPSAVSVVIKASPENINYISSMDLTASIDLNTITESGTYEIPVKISLSNRVLAFDPLEVRVTPETISVSVDKKISKNVKIVPSTVGDVGDGYKIDTVSVVPSFVEIIGPQLIVDKTEYVVTDKVIVSNAESNFSVDTYYSPITKLYEVTDKGPYKVTVSLTAEETEKTFYNVPVSLINLSDEFEVDNKLAEYNLTLKGFKRNLDDYNVSKNVLYLDMKSVTEEGEYELPLNYQIPSFLTLESELPSSVFVNVVLKTVEESESETDAVLESETANQESE